MLVAAGRGWARVKFAIGLTIGIILGAAATAAPATLSNIHWFTNAQLQRMSDEVQLGYVAGAFDMLSMIVNHYADYDAYRGKLLDELAGKFGCLSSPSRTRQLDDLKKWYARRAFTAGPGGGPVAGEAAGSILFAACDSR
jgi:hypothetical protein